jgi:hypothetical protein
VRGFKANLFSNEKINFTVQFEPEETVNNLIDSLREKVKEVGGKNA